MHEEKIALIVLAIVLVFGTLFFLLFGGVTQPNQPVTTTGPQYIPNQQEEITEDPQIIVPPIQEEEESLTPEEKPMFSCASFIDKAACETEDACFWDLPRVNCPAGSGPECQEAAKRNATCKEK